MLMFFPFLQCRKRLIVSGEPIPSSYVLQLLILRWAGQLQIRCRVAKKNTQLYQRLNFWSTSCSVASSANWFVSLETKGRNQGPEPCRRPRKGPPMMQLELEDCLIQLECQSSWYQWYCIAQMGLSRSTWISGSAPPDFRSAHTCHRCKDVVSNSRFDLKDMDVKAGNWSKPWELRTPMAWISGCFINRAEFGPKAMAFGKSVCASQVTC